MKKINLYVFIQIFKSCTLVFFIFVSIAWLLQISRLFSFLGNFQVKFLDIFYLSLFLIPNLINVILPFIVIFGLIIAFIKFDKDKEIIAIFSLGLSINEVRKPLINFSIFIILIYIFLNYFISSIVYEIYKKKEFELRNLLDFNNINIANFIQLDDKLILDFVKIDNKFKDVFIRFTEVEENLIYADNAKIEKLKNEIIFNLNNGFKLSFKDSKIEKLEFENYKFKFTTKENIFYNNIDQNSITLIQLIKNKDYKTIIEKIAETLLIIVILYSFYFLIIKKHNYTIKNIFVYLIISIFIVINLNIIKKTNMDINYLISAISINLLIPFIYILIKIKN